MSNAGLRLGVRGLAVVLVASLAVLRIRRRLVTDGRSLGVVALADLCGSGVLGERVRVVLIGLLVASEAGEEASLAAIARGIVVGGARAEARFLASVADENNLHDR